MKMTKMASYINKWGFVIDEYELVDEVGNNTIIIIQDGKATVVTRGELNGKLYNGGYVPCVDCDTPNHYTVFDTCKQAVRWLAGQNICVDRTIHYGEAVGLVWHWVQY